MRYVATILLGVVFLAGCLGAQSKEDLRRRFEAKLKRPCFTQTQWHTDFTKAVKDANSQKQLIFAYFTSSIYDEKRCDAIEKKKLLSKWWREETTGMVKFFHVAHGAGKDPIRYLRRECGGATVPYLVILNSKKEVLTEVSRDFDEQSLRAAVARARKLDQLHNMKLPTRADLVAARTATMQLLDACGRGDRKQLKSNAVLEKALKTKGVPAEVVREYKKLRVYLGLRSVRHDQGLRILNQFKCNVVPPKKDALKFYSYAARAAINQREEVVATKIVDLYEEIGLQDEAVMKFIRADVKFLRKRIWDVSP